jgi:hypothetical protein
MYSIRGSLFPYGDYRTEMGRETRIFPYGESPFPNRVCFHLGINIYTCMGVPSGPFFIHIPASCLCLCLCCKAVHDIAPCFCSALLLHLIAYGTLHIYINTWKLNVYRITPHFTRAMVGQLSVTNSSVSGQKGNIVFRCAKNRAFWVIMFFNIWIYLINRHAPWISS